MAKEVILYSGGMDSFCLSKFYPKADLLYVNMHTAESEFEMKLIPAFTQVIDLPLGQFELENKIIPFRNCFLVMAAAQSYSKIYIGATAGDTTKDKDFVFKAQMEAMLNYFGIDENKMAHSDRPFEVVMPFKKMTKVEILEAYLLKGFDIDELVENSRSCYAGDQDKECGVCRACLRKYIAFAKIGKARCLNFMHFPTRSELGDFLDQCIMKGRDKKELEEIKEVLCGDSI
jgi:7-cyano-7-deazaguanine synthase